MNVDKKINSLEDFFRNISFPLQPLKYETKLVLDTFFGEGGFINVCDMIFGPLVQDERRGKDGGLSWMDAANVYPNGKMAASLFRLLAPGGNFCYLLESLSVPQHDFASRLKKTWKGDAGVEVEPGPLFRFFDFPLSALHHSFHNLLEEAPETNLFDLPRSKCPPVMLIPFWMPPLVTRVEPNSRRVLTSLRCSPIAYFILRMVLYGVRRTDEDATAVVRLPKVHSFGTRVRALSDMVFNLFKGPSCTDLPLYHRLLTAYIQYFVSSTHIQKFSCKRSIEEIQWSVPDVAAALLLFAPSHLWMRGTNKLDSEKYRTPYKDVVSAAQVFRLVPFLTECLFALYQKDQGKVYASCWGINQVIKRDICDSRAASAAWDVLNPQVAFYRNVINVLRQALISFENYNDCRREHFNNTLELWYAVMNPTGRLEDLTESYVVYHYEAYSYIMFDAVLMFLKSNFLEGVDITGATIWSRCAEVFTSPAVQSVFREVSNAAVGVKCGIMESIGRHFTLNWVDEDGLVCVMRPYADEVLWFLAEVYMSTELRLEKCDLDDDTRCLLRLSIDYIAKSFKNISSFVDKCRLSRASTSRVSPNISLIPSRVEGCVKRTGNEKDFFFRGIRLSCNLLGPLNARFDTENIGFLSRNDSFGEVCFSDEFPLLVTLTEWLDAFFVFIFELYYRSWVPRCSNGHKLWLLSSNSHYCMNHPQQLAMWECFLCEEVYGCCCRSKPRGLGRGSLGQVEIDSSVDNPFVVSALCFCNQSCLPISVLNQEYYSVRIAPHARSRK